MSEQPKLSPWFGADVKPVRIGVYKTRINASIGGGYSYWDGARWGLECLYRDNAALAARLVKLGRQDKQWRGLAADPETKP